MRIDIKETKKEGWVQITTLDERWYRRETDGQVFPSSTWIAGYYPKGVEYMKWLASKGWDEAEAIKTARGEHGSRVHHAIACLLAGSQLSMTDVLPDNDGNQAEFTVEEWRAVLSFGDFWADFCKEGDVEVVDFEMNDFNEEHGYAGTRDIRVRRGGEFWTLDVKTSKHIWPSHEIQLASYGMFPGCEDDKLAIVQVGYPLNKRLWKFTPVEKRFDLFLAARAIWAHENENVRPRQYELPTTLKLSHLKEV